MKNEQRDICMSYMHDQLSNPSGDIRQGHPAGDVINLVREAVHCSIT